MIRPEQALLSRGKLVKNRGVIGLVADVAPVTGAFSVVPLFEWPPKDAELKTWSCVDCSTVDLREMAEGLDVEGNAHN